MASLTQSEAAEWSKARGEMIAADRASATETLEREAADAPTPEDDREREKDAARKRAERAKKKAAPPPDPIEEPEDPDPDSLGVGEKKLNGADEPEDPKEPETPEPGKEETPAEKKARQLEAAVKDARARQRAAEARLAEQDRQYAERLRAMERLFDQVASRAPEQEPQRRQPADPFADRPKVDAELLAKLHNGQITDPLEKLRIQEQLLLQFAAREQWRDQQEAQRLARQQERRQAQTEQEKEAEARRQFNESVAAQAYAIVPDEQRGDFDEAFVALRQARADIILDDAIANYMMQGGDPRKIDVRAWKEWALAKANDMLHLRAGQAIRSGQFSADMLFAEAKRFAGWQSKAEKEAAEARAATPAPAPAPAPEPEDPDEQIERLRENRRAAGPGASGGGGAPKSSIISIEDVASIEDENKRYEMFKKYHAQRKAAARKNPRAVG